MTETALPIVKEASGEPELGYGQLFSILWRRIYWVGGALAASLGLAVAATLVQSPKYQSSMQLLVEPNVTQTFTLNDEDTQPESFSEVELDYVTQLNLMRSEPFLEQAVEVIEQTSPDFCQTAETRERCIKDFEDALHLFQVEEGNTDTRIFEATFVGEEAQIAQDSLQALQQVYLAYNLQRQDRRLEEGLTLVNRQISEVQAELGESQKALQTFRQNERLIAPEEQSLSMANALEQLVQEQQSVDADYQEARAQYDALQQVLALDPQSALMASRLSQSSRFQRLLDELQTSEVALSERLSVHTEADPIAQDLLAQREIQTTLLQQEGQRLLNRSAQQQAGSNQAAFPQPFSSRLESSHAESTFSKEKERLALAPTDDAFAEAVRIAERAGVDGQTASTAAEWLDLEARWQKASHLMAQVAEGEKAYEQARDRVKSYADNSQAALQKANILQANAPAAEDFGASGQVSDDGFDLLAAGQLGEIDLGLINSLIDSQITLTSLEARQKSLAGSEQALREKLGRFPRLIAEHDRLQPEVESHRTSLEQLLEIRQQLSNDIAQGGFKWDVVEPPNLGKKVAPSPVQNLLMGAVAGLFLGGLLAYVRDSLDTVIRTPEDLKNQGGLPLLGVLPEVSESFMQRGASACARLQSGDAAAILSLVHWPPFREAVDLIYKNIQMTVSPLKSVMVTSAIASEGKTTLALGLAISAARSQKRVLLIDANLRHPILHKQLGLSNKRGLTMLLASVEPPMPVPVSLAGTQLDILTAGPLSEDPVQLLNSHRMKELIVRLERQHDLIVFDTSAVLGRVDALQIASLCRGVVLVSRLEQLSQGELSQATTTLARVKQLGIVANGHQGPIPQDDRLSDTETIAVSGRASPRSPAQV